MTGMLLVPALFQTQLSAFDGEIETLDAIKVPSTFVLEEERNIAFPAPNTKTVDLLPTQEMILLPVLDKPRRHLAGTRVIRDAIADTLGVRSAILPAKAERPPYPRIARQQGWEGVVVLRVTIHENGTVASTHIRDGSGHSILDESAKHTVDEWTFVPVKDGEVPIAVTIDIPIRFSLNEVID